MNDSPIELVLGLDDADDIEILERRTAKKLRISVSELGEIEILKRSVDARRGKVQIRYWVRRCSTPKPKQGGQPLREVSRHGRIVIVGAGPAGLFCAYQLARSGVASVVIERGKKVQPRRVDLKGLTKGGIVNEDSNYCFGEGGAGTYSDGKLYTRSHKRGNVLDIIEILVDHGAPRQILSDARPHIGSNKLPKVVTAIREHLESVGVEFRFGAKVIDLDRAGGRVIGVVLDGGEAVHGDAVVVATGHSARDVFGMLHRADVQLESKGFALGVRVEHPQSLIDAIQYGNAAGHPKLSAAPYRLAHDIGGRGVFSFCMCPGGWIVPASTESGGLVVNGMSLSKRDSAFANSGLVVTVHPTDWEQQGYRGSLGGVDVQNAIEKAAWQAGGGNLVAPATRISDFVHRRSSESLPLSSYVPGLRPAAIGEIVDSSGIELSERLRTALRVFNDKMPGYSSDEAVMVGVETRTSSPVRVLRDPETMQCPSLPGLYPCGEGAGYAGGIVSAAMDGVRVARALTLVVRSGDFGGPLV